jgi:hypothetical protein
VCAFPIGVFAQPKVHRAAPPEEAARLEEVKGYLLWGEELLVSCAKRKTQAQKNTRLENFGRAAKREKILSLFFSFCIFPPNKRRKRTKKNRPEARVCSEC